MSVMLDVLAKRREISELAAARDRLDRRGRDSAAIRKMIDKLRQELTALKLGGVDVEA
jgi:hypothetical protein